MTDANIAAALKEGKNPIIIAHKPGFREDRQLPLPFPEITTDEARDILPGCPRMVFIFEQ